MLQAINAHNARNEGKVLIICHNARPRCGLAKLAHSWRREIDGESVTVFTGAAWGGQTEGHCPVRRPSKQIGDVQPDQSWQAISSSNAAHQLPPNHPLRNAL